MPPRPDTPPRRPGAVPLALASGVVYTLHMPAGYAILVGKNPPRALALLLPPLLLGPLAVRMLHERGPRARIAAMALATLYYTLVLAYLAAFLYLALPLGPGRFAAMSIWAIVFGLAIRRDRPASVWAMLLAPVALAGNLRPLAAPAVAALLLPGVLLRRRTDRAGLGALPLAVMMFSLLAHLEGLTFYRGASLFDRFRRPDPRVVTPLHLPVPADEGPRAAVDPRFVIPGCGDDLLYGVRGAARALFRFPRGAVSPAAEGLDGEAGDQAVVDCARESIYAGDYGGAGVYRLDAANLVERARFRLPSRRPTFVERDPDGRRLYVATDFDGTLHVLDAATGQVLRSLRAPGGIVHFALDSVRERVIAAGGGADLFTFEPGSDAPTLRRKFRGGLILQIAYDPRRDRVYLSNFLSGWVTALDGATFATVARRWLGAGVRFFSLLPDGRLAVAQYFAGTVTLLDGDDLAVLSRAYVGKRVRWLAPAADGREILTTTAAGPIAIDVAALAAAR